MPNFFHVQHQYLGLNDSDKCPGLPLKNGWFGCSVLICPECIPGHGKPGPARNSRAWASQSMPMG
jgi:hypothetical protein